MRLKTGLHAELVAMARAPCPRSSRMSFGEAAVGEAHGLERAEIDGVLRQAARADLLFHLRRCSAISRMNHGSYLQAAWICSTLAPRRNAWATLRMRSGVGVPSAARMAFLSSPSPTPSMSISFEPGQAGLEPAQGLLQRFLEGAADRHDFADRFHRGGEDRLGAGEFLEGEARNLGDHIVDGRLEGGGRGAAGDVVGEFIQRVADGEPRRDLGDRKAGRLGGERGGARHARVHLDDDEAAVLPD